MRYSLIGEAGLGKTSLLVAACAAAPGTMGRAGGEALEVELPFGVAIEALRPWPENAATLAQDLAAGGRAKLERIAPPAGAGSAIRLARCGPLDERALACARAASVCDASFRPDVAREIAGLSDGDGAVGIDALWRDGLLVAAGPATLRFADPLFAEALVEELPLPTRLRMHAAAFRALADRGLEAEAAQHAIRAQLVGDRRATALLERVGRRALATGAVASAARHLAAAQQLGGEDTDPGVSIALGEALTATGDLAGALEVLRRARSETLDWTERQAALRAYGRALLLTGAVAESKEALDQAIALAIKHGRAVLAVQPLLDLCLTTWVIQGPAAALEFSARARELAADAEPDLRERAVATWGHLSFEAGDVAGLDATAFLGERLDGGRVPRPIGPEEFVFPWGTIEQYAMNCLQAERFDAAERAYRAVAAAAEKAGAVSALTAISSSLALLLTRRGRLEEAMVEVRRGLELTELTPGTLAYIELAHAEALLWLGRLEESEQAASRAEQQAVGLWYDRLYLAHLRGLRLLWEGDARASDELLGAEELSLDAGVAEPGQLQWAGHAVDAHLAVGRLEDATRVVDWLEQRAAALPSYWPRIAARVGRAQLDAEAGHDEAAEAGFRSALQLHASAELPLAHVESLLAYGRFLRRRSRAVDARGPLGEAHQRAETVGARWLAQAARRELGLAGGRRRRCGEDRDRLTAAERCVAEFAADGLTNAEIARRLYLSVSTVETHLRHVYAKLEIRSRRELMRLDHSFGPGPAERRHSST